MLTIKLISQYIVLFRDCDGGVSPSFPGEYSFVPSSHDPQHKAGFFQYILILATNMGALYRDISH